MLSRLAETAYLWDQILEVKPQNPVSTRYSLVRTWEQKSWVVVSRRGDRFVTENGRMQQVHIPGEQFCTTKDRAPKKLVADVVFCNQIKKQKHHLRELRIQTNGQRDWHTTQYASLIWDLRKTQDLGTIQCNHITWLHACRLFGKSARKWKKENLNKKKPLAFDYSKNPAHQRARPDFSQDRPSSWPQFRWSSQMKLSIKIFMQAPSHWISCARLARHPVLILLASWFRPPLGCTWTLQLCRENRQLRSQVGKHKSISRWNR